MQIEDIDSISIPYPDEGKAWSGLPMARIGLRAVFYVGNAYSREVRQQLMALVDEYLAMSGGQIRAYQRAGDRRRMSAGPGRAVDLERLRERVENFKTDWAIEASAEEDINVATPWSFVTAADDAGFFLAHFPLSAFKVGASETFREWFQRWCSALGVEHAYAGLGFVLPVGGTSMFGALKRLGPLATRFIGLDLDYPGSVATRCRDGIRTVNWLTAIDEKRLHRAGGAQTVLNVAGSDVTSLAYSRGTVFVAGPAPEIGDEEAGKLPSAYFQLGRAVASLRSDIPEIWFTPPEGYEAPDGFTSKSGWSDAEPEELPALHYLKTWMARFD